MELDGRELDDRPLEPDRPLAPPPEPLLLERLLRAERLPDDDAGALRVGSSLPSRDDDVERVERVRLEGGGFELADDEGSFERRRGRRSSGGAARRTGVSQ